jgi:hypothetical protein
MIPTSIVPLYQYPGGVFDELGSLVTVMPDYPAFAMDIWSTPASTDARNIMASSIMQSGITPYGE